MRSPENLFANENGNDHVRLIPRTPHLLHIEKTLSILEPKEDENWKNLSEKIGHWQSSLELTDMIRQTVREYIQQKIPILKEHIPSIKEFDDEDLLDALTNGWFEGLENVSGKRKEVLLSVAAHIVKRIENRIYKSVIEKSDENALFKLGLNNNTKKLATDVLDASVKMDPLFIRFLAHSGLTSRPPEDANNVALTGAEGDNKHTYRELFPHESNFISEKLNAIAENDSMWANEPESAIFKDYVVTLSAFFKETDPDKAMELQESIEKTYGALIASDFPIAMVPQLEGYYNPPYLDPEMRVILRTPDSKSVENNFYSVKDSIVNNLSELGVEEFSQNIKKAIIRSYVSVGNFGAGMIFNAIAQEDKGAIIFLNEHLRAFDSTEIRELLKYFDSHENSISKLSDASISALGQEDTMMHELSHNVFDSKSMESIRLGPEPARVMAEINAEAIYRGLLNKLTVIKSSDYSKEEYLAFSLALSLSVLASSDPDDEYHKASVYTLNRLFESGTVEFDGAKITVKNYEQVLSIFRENAKKIINVYRDESMSEKKAKKWIKNNTTSGPKLAKVIAFLKETDAE